jgi:hypothetical protein
LHGRSAGWGVRRTVPSIGITSRSSFADERELHIPGVSRLPHEGRRAHQPTVLWKASLPRRRRPLLARMEATLRTPRRPRRDWRLSFLRRPPVAAAGVFLMNSVVTVVAPRGASSTSSPTPGREAARRASALSSCGDCSQRPPCRGDGPGVLQLRRLRSLVLCPGRWLVDGRHAGQAPLPLALSPPSWVGPWGDPLPDCCRREFLIPRVQGAGRNTPSRRIRLRRHDGASGPSHERTTLWNP